MKKMCAVCYTEKTAEYFHKDKYQKDNLYSCCKECRKEKTKESGKRYYQKNREKMLEKIKDKYWSDPEAMRKYKTNLYHKNKDKILEKKRQRYADDPTADKAASLKWRKKNREKAIETSKKWREENKERRSLQRKEYHARKKQDPVFRISHSMSGRMRSSLRNMNVKKRHRPWEGLVGYTAEDLKEHLEGLFVDGMSWNNYGDWHIDHIKPVSSFSFESLYDSGFLECWSLANLQPLWAFDNLSKGAGV